MARSVATRQKIALAFSVLFACSRPAIGQSSIEIYGVVDLGIVHEHGGVAGSVTKVVSGVESGSRIGFKGREDLGGGASAFFVLESGLSADTGSGAQGVNRANSSGIFWGRQAFVGLSAPGYGSISFGRQYTPVAVALITIADPFSGGLAGTVNNIFNLTGLRANNAIAYTSADYGCFSAGAMLSLGEQPDSNSRGAGFGAFLNCTSGPLQIPGAYFRRNSLTAGVDPARTTVLTAKYKFDALQVHAAAEVNRGPGSDFYPGQLFLVPPEVHNPYGAVTPPVPSTDSRNWLIGVSVPLGAGNLLASYIDHRDRTPLKQDASQIAFGYQYFLSKRTDLYTSFARIRNRNGAGFTVGNAGDVTFGSGNRAFNYGVRHAF